jgi:hypothetical protein
VVHNALLLVAAIPVCLVTRGLPGPWPLFAFLVLFLPVACAAVGVHQWFRWRYAALELRAGSGRVPAGTGGGNG